LGFGNNDLALSVENRVGFGSHFAYTQYLKPPSIQCLQKNPQRARCEEPRPELQENIPRGQRKITVPGTSRYFTAL
jgi:hypothetical protein